MPAWTLAGALMLGGLLPLGPDVRGHWAPSGAWRMPVGDPYFVTLERQPAPGPFFVVRNVEWDGVRASHQGADLGSGAEGAIVCAAAAGLVVHTGDHGENGGYGTHVVLAHRLAEGVIAYSVYAHLRESSIRVKPGRFVPAGTPLGRVGMTGRASAAHLHFEIRIARDPDKRWELADVEDPLAFIEERLPAHRADSTGVAAYLEWGEFAALLAPGARGDDVLTRERWWRMLAAAARGPLLDPASSGGSLRDSLVHAGLLADATGTEEARAAVSWAELAHDLSRARRVGARTGPGPFRRERHERVCADHFGESTPSRRTSILSARAGTPSLTDAVLLVADLAGPAPEPARPKAPAKPGAAKPGAASGVGALAQGTARAAAPGAGRSLAARSRPDSLAPRARTRVAGDSLRAGATRTKAAADSLRVAAVRKARPDSVMARSRGKSAADSLARASRAGGAADTLPAPRPLPPRPALAADSSGR